MPQPRQTCYCCMRPKPHCYCPLIQKITTALNFVILMHPLERKRKIATGRMAHLCLSQSELIEGCDFNTHKRVNQLIANPENHCMVLYPGANAIDLSAAKIPQNQSLIFPDGKRPVLFIIDGTWSTAKKTMKTSTNLQQLQSIRFTPATPSQFRVRRQPHDHCYSTIEAIHQILDLTENHNRRSHDVLLKVFADMVERQLDYQEKCAVR